MTVFPCCDPASRRLGQKRRTMSNNKKKKETILGQSASFVRFSGLFDD